MSGRIVNMASGNTIKTINQPIAWLFNHSGNISHFEAKPLQDSGGYLTAYLDNNTMFVMPWVSYRVMMDTVLNSRAWRNHFSGINVRATNGTEYTI